jgi:CBS domain-containing protein
MPTHVHTTSPDAPVQEAARLMREQRIGCLPVVVQEQRVGILTEYDLLQGVSKPKKV